MIPWILPMLWQKKYLKKPWTEKRLKKEKKLQPEINEMRKYNKLVQEKINSD